MKNKITYLAKAATFGLCISFAAFAYAQEVPTAPSDEPTPVNFPGRSSLGEMKEGALPSLSDSGIKDMPPMNLAVSKKASPSEQLLGSIDSRVFHDMAELERGNVFLKLHAQREQLKNDLEKLKAAYRQARLDEIEKREGVIRTRVEWMQEQERIRQEIQEKKMQTELLEKQIEETEMRKDEIIAEKQRALNPTAVKAAPAPVVVAEKPAETKAAPKGLPQLTVLDVRGMKGNLTARLFGDDGKVFPVKVGSQLSGYTVKSISKTEVVFDKNGVQETLMINPMFVSVPTASAQ